MGRFRSALTIHPRYNSRPVPGLPGAAMVLTNSTRKDLICGRRWWFSQGLALNREASAAMRFGSSFDRVMEGILEWYSVNPDAQITMEDLEVPGEGSLARVTEAMVLEADSYPDGVEAEITRLTRAVDGWVRRYSQAMAEDFLVLDAQPMIAVPVTSPTTGKVYRSKVPVVKIPEGWRVATAWDSPEEVSLVTLPWFQLAKLDGVVLHRSSGTVYAWETKTAANPDGYSRDLHLDTQLPGYTRALWYATKVLGLYGGRDVGGYVWDVTSNRVQNDPTVLASGRISMAKSTRVPSWRWEEVLVRLLDGRSLEDVRSHRDRLTGVLATATASLEALTEAARAAPRGKAGASAREARNAAREGVKSVEGKLADLQEVLDVADRAQESLESVDPALYVRRWGEFSTHALAQYEVELFRDAVKIGENLRRSIGTSAAIPSGSPDSLVPTDLDLQVAHNFPRVPVCRMPGGFCPYTGPCLQDGETVRDTFTRREPIRFLDTQHARAWTWDGVTP